MNELLLTFTMFAIVAVSALAAASSAYQLVKVLGQLRSQKERPRLIVALNHKIERLFLRSRYMPLPTAGHGPIPPPVIYWGSFKAELPRELMLEMILLDQTEDDLSSSRRLRIITKEAHSIPVPHA